MNSPARRAPRPARVRLPDVRLLMVFVAIVLVVQAAKPIFLSPAHLASIVTTQVIEIALVTAGQMLVIITAGIDLSVGGVIDLVSVSVGKMAEVGAPVPLLFVGGLGIGTMCGLANGLVITRLKVPPIITTLASGILFRGIAEGLANGNYFLGFPDSFRWLGQGTWAGLPSQLWVAALVLFVLGFGLGQTRYGRWIYAVGQNERAARLSGVPSNSMLVGVYVTSAALASLAGMIMTARLDSSAPFLGSGLELASITAAVLGGISVYGGKGTMIGCLLGVLTMSAVRAGLTLLGVTTSIQAMFVAILLLFVLLLTQVSLRSALLSARPPALPRHDKGPSTQEALEQEIDQ